MTTTWTHTTLGTRLIARSRAAEGESGLGRAIAPGLIYAGLAGATRSRSGRKSTNTLWDRIRGMHLGGRHEFSTFRLGLGAILANARNEPRSAVVGSSPP
jgi:hypothetical protein